MTLGNLMAKSKHKLPVAMPSEVNTAPKSDKEHEARERRYKAEDALRDMERVEGYRRNKELMRDVKILAKEKINNLGKIK